MTDMPPGTFAGGAPEYYDAQTLRRLEKLEWARRRALQWRDEHEGEWPSVRLLERIAEVSFGSAAEGLRRAKQSDSG